MIDQDLSEPSAAPGVNVGAVRAFSPFTTFVHRAAFTMPRLRTANAIFPKADSHEAVLAAIDAAICTEVGEAQTPVFANSAFRLDLAIHHAAAPRVKADAGR